MPTLEQPSRVQLTQPSVQATQVAFAPASVRSWAFKYLSATTIDDQLPSASVAKVTSKPAISSDLVMDV
jgi:hypothetical protein